VDLKKLTWMNGEYMLKLPEESFKALALERLADVQADETYIDSILKLIRERVKTLADIVPMTRHFFAEELEYDPKPFRKKIQKEGVKEILEQIKNIFSELEPFTEKTAEEAIHAFMQETGLGFGAVMAPLRIALTGTQAGPDLFPMLDVLGKTRVLARLDQTLKLC